MNRIIRLLAFVLFAASLNAAEPARKPNIIFVLADDLGHDDIGPFGQKIIHTPTLDKMPGVTRAGTVCDTPVSTMEFFQRCWNWPARKIPPVARRWTE